MIQFSRNAVLLRCHCIFSQNFTHFRTVQDISETFECNTFFATFEEIFLLSENRTRKIVHVLWGIYRLIIPSQHTHFSVFVGFFDYFPHRFCIRFSGSNTEHINLTTCRHSCMNYIIALNSNVPNYRICTLNGFYLIHSHFFAEQMTRVCSVFLLCSYSEYCL